MSVGAPNALLHGVLTGPAATSGQLELLDGPLRGLQLPLVAGMYFSVHGRARIWAGADALGLACTHPAWTGPALTMGGVLEAQGALCYIDGCSDSLLLPPVVKGAPCLNFLHFPDGTVQTPHTHSSYRATLIVAGQGECVLADGPPVPLHAGDLVYLDQDTVHSFNTAPGHTMDLVAYHPDSDYGPTADNHPMVNRTLVNGCSSALLPHIRTTDAQLDSERAVLGLPPRQHPSKNVM